MWILREVAASHILSLCVETFSYLTSGNKDAGSCLPRLNSQCARFGWRGLDNGRLRLQRQYLAKSILKVLNVFRRPRPRRYACVGYYGNSNYVFNDTDEVRAHDSLLCNIVTSFRCKSSQKNV